MSFTRSRLFLLMVLTSAAVASVVTMAQTRPGQTRPAPTAPQPAPAASAPVSADARWQRAVDACEAGKYPEALQDLRALIQSPASADYFERVALLTGELYVSTVLTTDGRNPRIAGNGAFASYETGMGPSLVTRVVRMAPSPTVAADLQTTTVAFDRSGRRLAWLRATAPTDPAATEIVVRDLTSGSEQVWLGPGLQKSGLMWSGDDQSVIFVGGQAADAARNDIYSVRQGSPPVALTDQPGFKSAPIVDARGATLAYTVAAASPFAARGGGAGGRAGGGGGGGGGRGGGAGTTYGIVSLADKTTRTVTGNALALSSDGSAIAWITRDADTYTLNAAPAATAQPAVIRSGRDRLDAPSLSPDGRNVAYQMMTNTDWEIYVSTRDATPVHRRITRDIQHDLLPRFLSNTSLIGLMGEARHRRSQLYDLTTGTRTRLFSNNSIRTVSPEYVWTPSADGQHLILQAERDGDTVSVERDVTVLDLTKKISQADLLTRVDRQLAAENDLRSRMAAAFKPIAARVRSVVDQGAINRVYAYEKSLFDFDSKYITQPGNLKAIEYLEKTYRSFGYTPEVQWFTPPALQASGGRTGNVVATLKGTVNPELIYVVSSHFDSVAVGPGADDDTSGTAALLEAARMLSKTPMPATIVFASFTGEEAGLLGSREFVRRAQVDKWQVAGALNNDMIGWAADSSQINNTIRYSNPGIRDLQHGASFLFTDLVLFDAKYYKSTDAAAFYDGWGDIVGGIGSYPILANPNYHQPTDFIETMSFKQILETAKVTAATLMYLASSPARLKQDEIVTTRTATGVEVKWPPSREKGVTKYIVAYGPANDPMRTRMSVLAPSATIATAPVGTHIAIKAINAAGMEGWDWARTVVK
jgi:Tol biopolymer transport system component